MCGFTSTRRIGNSRAYRCLYINIYISLRVSVFVLFPSFSFSSACCLSFSLLFPSLFSSPPRAPGRPAGETGAIFPALHSLHGGYIVVLVCRARRRMRERGRASTFPTLFYHPRGASYRFEWCTCLQYVCGPQGLCSRNFHRSSRREKFSLLTQKQQKA